MSTTPVGAQKVREWNARQSPEWKRERARNAAIAMHVQGKTNTGPALAAFNAKFAFEEERRAHFSAMGKSPRKKPA